MAAFPVLPRIDRTRGAPGSVCEGERVSLPMLGRELGPEPLSPGVDCCNTPVTPYDESLARDIARLTTC